MGIRKLFRAAFCAPEQQEARVDNSQRLWVEDEFRKLRLEIQLLKATVSQATNIRRVEPVDTTKPNWGDGGFVPLSSHVVVDYGVVDVLERVLKHLDLEVSKTPATASQVVVTKAKPKK